jgi:hypothetical protein
MKKLINAGAVRMNHRAEQHFFLGVPKECRRRAVRIYFEVLRRQSKKAKPRRNR